MADEKRTVQQRIKLLEAANGKTRNTVTGTASVPLEIELLRQVAETLWLPQSLPEEARKFRLKAVIAALEGIKPEDEVEGMLAVQLVATHSAAMECLRRAMLAGLTPERRNMELKHAEKLLTIYTRQLETLDKHRGKGQQKVTVEHVHVEAGGQAIVGQVETGGRDRRQHGNEAPAERAPEAPLETSAREAKSSRREQ